MFLIKIGLKTHELMELAIIFRQQLCHQQMFVEMDHQH